MFLRLFSLFIGSTLLISSHLSAQVDSVTVEKVSIINAKHKIDGIYKTFDDFRRNQPFYTDSFTVVTGGKSWIEQTKLGEFLKVEDPGMDYIDHINFKNSTEPIRSGIGGQRYFGYCKDGEVHIGFWRFHKVEKLGHLTPIHVVEYRFRHFGSTGLQNNQMKYGYDKWLVLDYMTGELVTVDSFSLWDKFEKWDKELFKEYRSTKNKLDVHTKLDFIEKFNERNPIRF